MAPFPEDEIMTIKRLEVALRKSDFKLLKEGAYKLHEKYHAHHHFEYLDLLKEILEEVQANYAVPPDIKDILVPTIQDILLNNQNQNRVSSLTSLSYGINSKTQEMPEAQKEETYQNTQYQENKFNNDNFNEPKEYIKPFQEFTPIKPIEALKEETKAESNFNDGYTNTFVQKPFEDFDTGVPVMEQQNIFENHLEEKPEKSLVSESLEQKEYLSGDEIVQEEFMDTEEEKIEYLSSEEDEIKNSEVEEEIEENIEEEAEEELIEAEEISQEETIEEQKSIAIFFGQNSSNEKIKNIDKYHNLLYGQSDFSINEITGLINEIKTQADNNVSELQVLLEKLKVTNHNINLITNSQSANLTDMLIQSDISYSIFNPAEDKRINILPIFGLTNLYKCIECDSEHLENNEKINSFILQCPKCKGPMLPDLYTVKGKINIDYYNNATIALANSDIWLLIHPSLNEKFTMNMIRTSMKVSSKVKEIYILDKDINVRETYRKLFEDINPDIKVNISLNVVEEFFSNI